MKTIEDNIKDAYNSRLKYNGAVDQIAKKAQELIEDWSCNDGKLECDYFESDGLCLVYNALFICPVRVFFEQVKGPISLEEFFKLCI